MTSDPGAALEASVVDLHLDLAIDLHRHRATPARFGQEWLPALRAGGVAAQVCPVFVADVPAEAALRVALEQVAAVRAAAEACADAALVTTRAELDGALAGERLALVLGLERADPLGTDPALADVFWALGVRVFGLTWNHRNAFADGNADPPEGGLSARGRELVARLAALGAIVDLAHASARTFVDGLDATPPGSAMASHIGCRALHDHPRNLTDEQLRALAAHGGVAGVFALALFLGPPRPPLALVVDHVAHAVSVAGEAAVALGGDFLGRLVASGATAVDPSHVERGLRPDLAVEGLADPDDYPALLAALADRLGRERAAAVAGGNALRFMRAALPA
jgi:membrane dipeptidase